MKSHSGAKYFNLPSSLGRYEVLLEEQLIEGVKKIKPQHTLDRAFLSASSSSSSSSILAWKKTKESKKSLKRKHLWPEYFTPNYSLIFKAICRLLRLINTRANTEYTSPIFFKPNLETDILRIQYQNENPMQV